MTIGKKLKHYRVANNLTQKELSKLTGIHIVTIKKYETDSISPSKKNINSIASILNINTNIILYPNVKLPYTSNGKLYKIFIDAIKNNIIIISNNSIIINPKMETIIGIKILNINDTYFKTSLIKWYNQYTELEALKLENSDLLNKKGNELFNKEKEIVFNIEKKELELNNIEMKLIYQYQ